MYIGIGILMSWLVNMAEELYVSYLLPSALLCIIMQKIAQGGT